MFFAQCDDTRFICEDASDGVRRQTPAFRDLSHSQEIRVGRRFAARFGFGLFRERTNLLDIPVVKRLESGCNEILTDNAGATRHGQGSGRLGNGGFDLPLLDPESEQSLGDSGEFRGLFEAVHPAHSTS